jgi:hypothetical protein
MANEKTFILAEEQRTVLLGYLYSRPYGEVAKGVAMLQALPEIPEAFRPVVQVPTLVEVKE